MKMEETASLSSDENVLTSNLIKDIRLLSDERLPDYIPSLDDELDNGDAYWSVESNEEVQDHELFKRKCKEYFTDDASVTPELCDYYTPHGTKRRINDEESRKRAKFDDWNEKYVFKKHRETPLPILLWTDSKNVWEIMMHKAEATSRSRNCRLFERTESILPRMRAILVEWLMEVCEVYRLRRTTYYFAIDYIDRYLSINPRVPKSQLQLLGISALYVAAKFEEIYAPKVSEFAYVCDGACTEFDILRCERLLLNALSWDLNHMTPTAWLTLYMQIHSDNRNLINNKLLTEYDISEFFVYPRYSAFDFIKACHLIDLFSLDPCFLLFSYNIIAASAIYFLYGKGCALKVSGLQWKDIESCIEYMAVFYTIIRNANDPKLECVATHVPIDRRDRATYNFLKTRVPDIVYGENHSMQTRCVNLDYFERATILRVQRMGFRIKKKFIKDKEEVAKDNNKNSETEHKEEEEAEDGEPHVVMFEVERDSALVASAYADCVSEVESSVEKDESKFFDGKSQFTFDEILEGINDCTIKKVLDPNKSSEKAINLNEATD